jgi:hypothetical protein
MTTSSSRENSTQCAPYDQITAITQKTINDGFVRLWNRSTTIQTMEVDTIMGYIHATLKPPRIEIDVSAMIPTVILYVNFESGKFGLNSLKDG